MGRNMTIQYSDSMQFEAYLERLKSASLKVRLCSTAAGREEGCAPVLTDCGSIVTLPSRFEKRGD
jgi:hypothetical protein